MAPVSLIKSLGSHVLLFVARVLTNITKRLPLRVNRFIGRRLGNLLYFLLRRTRRIGWDNLDLVYGDTLSRKQKARILREAMENIGIVAAEFGHLEKIDDAFIDKYVTIKNASLIDKSKGAVLIGGHLANWEWQGRIVKSLGIQLDLVVRKIKQTELDDFMDKKRRSGGVETLDRSGALVKSVHLLRQGRFVGMLIDHAPRQSGVSVNFLGKPCWGTPGPVIAAMRAHVPIHPVTMVRQDSGNYTLEILPAIELAQSGDFHQDILQSTQYCQDAIESIVKAHPEQWLWFYPRWKQRKARQRRKETVSLADLKQ